MTRRELWTPLSGLLLCGCDRLRQSKPVIKDVSELEIGYSILADAGTPKVVNEKHPFAAGERFRIQFRPAFPAFVYLLNRGANEQAYSFLFPNSRIALKNPLAVGQNVTLPDEKEWYTLDSHSGVENIVLVAATEPLAEFSDASQPIPRDDFDARLASLERDRRPGTSRRVEEHDRVRLYASRDRNPVIVLRIPLEHH